MVGRTEMVLKYGCARRQRARFICILQHRHRTINPVCVLLCTNLFTFIDRYRRGQKPLLAGTLLEVVLIYWYY